MPRSIVFGQYQMLLLILTETRRISKTAEEKLNAAFKLANNKEKTKIISKEQIKKRKPTASVFFIF